MTYKELNWYFKHVLHKEEPFELIDGYPRSKGGNMCYLCSKTDTCKYVLTGDLYFGQTVGPSADGNDFVYECPKFEYRENIWCRNDEINNGRLRRILSMYFMILRRPSKSLITKLRCIQYIRNTVNRASPCPFAL